MAAKHKTKPAVENIPNSDTKVKDKALDVAITQIERQYGKGSIMRLGEGASRAEIGVIRTGSVGLDHALGVGGVPRGRVVEIFGPESSGKTTLVLHIIANAQKQGGLAAFVDAEHALDPDYAKALGVDIDNLLVSQPDTGEEALEICEALVRSGALGVIVVDSVAALVPRLEIEGDMGDAQVGLQARLMSRAMRKLAAAMAKEFDPDILMIRYSAAHRGADALRNGNRAALVGVGRQHDELLTAIPGDQVSGAAHSLQ